MPVKNSFQDNKHHLTVIAALLAMVGPFTIDAYLPSFPDIELAFGISRAMLSQSLAVYLVAFAVSTLFWEPLSNRIDRRLVILFGLAMLMPAITIRALVCFPHNRGAAASMQGFFQMFINALVASIAVPLLHTMIEHLVFGQFVFLLMALLLWFLAKKLTASDINPQRQAPSGVEIQ